jgi:hypothetical protein
MCLIGGEMDWMTNPTMTRKMSHKSFGSQELVTKQQIINKSNPINTRSKWSTQALEKAMDVIERGTTSLRKANRHWNISLTSMFDHLYGKARSRKTRLTSVLIIEKDQVVVF